MALVNPVTIFPGYTLTGTAGSEIIGIPLAALNGLTAAEANATTGDIRAVLTSIVEKTRTGVGALAANARPSNFAITSARVTNTTDTDKQDLTYTIRGTLDNPVSALNFPAEP